MFEVHSIFLKYSSITINGKNYRSSGKRQQPLVVQLASWKNSLFGDPSTPLPQSTSESSKGRPVNVNYFMKVSITSGTTTESLFFANVSWFYPHPDRYACGKPVELWCNNFYESFGLHSFIPLDHLSSRCAHGTKVYHNEKLLFVILLVG